MMYLRTQVLLWHVLHRYRYTYRYWELYSLLLASGASLLVADLMAGVRQVDLWVRVRQAVRDQLQLQVLIVLTGMPYRTRTYSGYYKY